MSYQSIKSNVDVQCLLVDNDAMAEILRHLLDRMGHSTRKKSHAMSPIIWLFAISISGLLSTLYLCPKEHTYWLIPSFSILVGFVLLLFTAAYVYWSLKEPDRLGSEEFIENNRLLHCAEKSKDPNLIQGAMSSITGRQLVADPSPPPIASCKESSAVDNGVEQ